MDTAPAANVEAATPVVETRPVTDPQEAVRLLARFIRCRPGRAGNYCSGTGLVTALVNRERVKRLCACIENGVREAKAAEEARAAVGAAVTELAATAAGLPAPPPPEPRRILPGAREKLETLKRELARETARLTSIREAMGTAIAGVADDLASLQAEEAQNRRDAAAAEGTKRVAGAQLEELRARLAGLTTQVEEAKAAIERLQAEAGQFGARRMQAEADLKVAKGGRVKDEKVSADRVESLRYRLRQHLARWPELAEVAAS